MSRTSRKGSHRDRSGTFGVAGAAEMEPLPRGRHRLTRDEVAESQRGRLVRAMAEEMAEKGYARTSVAGVLRRARVSRETFYELFSSKEDCFMSAFEEAYSQFAAALTPATGEGRTPREPIDRITGLLRDYLGALAADPALARVFLIEVYAAGPEATRRRLELQQGLADAIAAATGARTKDERFAIEALLAAITQLVTSRLAAGEGERLPELHRPLLGLVRRLGVGLSESP